MTSMTSSDETPDSQHTADLDAGSTEIIELSREECLDLLAAHHFGRLAVVMGGVSPIIRPVNYVFDPRSQSVVFLTGRGSKLQALLRSAKAAFEIDGIDESTHTGWSVIIEGVTAEVTVPRDIGRLRRLGDDQVRQVVFGHQPGGVVETLAR